MICCFPGCIGMELDWKKSSQNRNRFFHVRCRHPKWQLTGCTATPSSVYFLICWCFLLQNKKKNVMRSRILTCFPWSFDLCPVSLPGFTFWVLHKCWRYGLCIKSTFPDEAWAGFNCTFMFSGYAPHFPSIPVFQEAPLYFVSANWCGLYVFIQILSVFYFLTFYLTSKPFPLDFPFLLEHSPPSLLLRAIHSVFPCLGKLFTLNF